VITVMIYLLIAALAAGLWWMDRAKEKRAAARYQAIRNTYPPSYEITEDEKRAAWEAYIAQKGPPLEIGPLPGGGFGFRVPPKDG
jgi:hypothetical protein